MSDDKTTADAIAMSMASRQEVTEEEVTRLRDAALRCPGLPPCFREFLLDQCSPEGEA